MMIVKKNKIALEELIKDIEAVSNDIRGEIIVEELLSNKLIEPDEISISNQGQFTRGFRNDVLGAKIESDNFSKQDYLNLLLSRDSLYDALPEGFIHNLNENNTDKSVGKMIEEHKYQKKQEDEARIFFAPFENEIFHYRTQIESVEKDFLYKLNGSKPVSFFYDFWGLSTIYPAILVSKCMQLLPYAYRIVGDIESACKCLSWIIDEKVSYNATGSKEYGDEQQEIKLGANSLGIDFIIGKSYIDYSMNLNIEIGPITNKPFQEYINDGGIKKFIDCFCEHFFPMEVEVKIIVLIHIETEEFNFNNLPVLGYTTRI